MAGMRQALRRFWNALPIDGAGFVAPGDPDARWLIRYATRRRLRAVPLGPLMVLAARFLFCSKAAGWARRGGSFRIFADAVLYGLLPLAGFWLGEPTAR